MNIPFIPLAGWDIDVLDDLEKLNCSDAETIQRSRDRIVMEYLIEGDVRPYADWVRRFAYRPSIYVSCALAEMMDPDETVRPEIAKVLPFKIKVLTRKGFNRGPKRNRENITRNRLFAQRTQEFRDLGYTLDAAVSGVKELVYGRGANADKDGMHQTIKVAYLKSRLENTKVK